MALAVDADTVALFRFNETAADGTGYATAVDAAAYGGTARNLAETGAGSGAGTNYTHIINGPSATRFARWFSGGASNTCARLTRAGDATMVATFLGSYTVECWVRPDNTVDTHSIYTYAGTNASETSVENYLSQVNVRANGSVEMFWEQGSGVNVSAASAVGILSMGVWQHLAITVDMSAASAVVTFYVDGMNKGSVASLTKPTGGGNATWTVGADASGATTAAFVGGLKDVHVSNVLRSPSYIAADAARASRQHVLDGNSVVCWRFNESPDAIDESTYGYHARKIAGTIEIVDPLANDGGRARHMSSSTEYDCHQGYATFRSMLQGDFTWEGWIRLDGGYDSATRGIWEWGDPGVDSAATNIYSTEIMATTRLFRAFQESGAGTDVVWTSATPVFTGVSDGYNKHFLAYVKWFDGSLYHHEVYLDGVLQLSGTMATAFDGGASGWLRVTAGTGAAVGGSIVPLIGVVDDFRWQKRRLLAAEILADYTNGVGLPPLITFSPASGTVIATTDPVSVSISARNGSLASASVAIVGSSPLWTLADGFSVGWSGSFSGGVLTLSKTGGYGAGVSVPFLAIATDTIGATTNAVASYTTPAPPAAVDPPVITLQSPSAGATIGDATPVVLRFVDANNDITSVLVRAKRDGLEEPAYWVSAYIAPYDASTSSSLGGAGNRELSITRTGGWQASTLVVTATAVDGAGNVVNFSVTFHPPGAAPETSIPPTSERTISAADGGDIALEWTGSAMDMAIAADDVATDRGLRTAILLSLLTDRRAGDGDTLPSDDGDRRGWWADQFAEVQGDRMGSRLWLLERSARRPDVARRAEELAREALAWLVEDRVASAVEVSAEVSGAALVLSVSVARPRGELVTFRFSHVWGGTEEYA